MAYSLRQTLRKRPWLIIAGISLLSMIVIYRNKAAPTDLKEQAIKILKQGALSHATDFAILCMTTQETSYDWMSFSNKHKYARKHGYDLIWDFEPANGYYEKVWDKLNITKDAVEATLLGKKNYKWLWMIDFDTLIMSTDVRLDSVVEQGLLFAELEGKSRDDMDLILTRDCQPLNAGSMFLRASPWILDFIEKWRSGADVLAWDSTDHNNLVRNEQEVLRDMLASNDFDVVNKSVIAPQYMFNAYPKELPCHDTRFDSVWKPGMFVMHFAGAGWVTKQDDAVGKFMRRYWPMIDTAP